MASTLGRIVLIGLVGLFAFLANAGGQTPGKPNFSGTWEVTEAPPNLKNRLLTITHAGDELTLADSYEVEKKQVSNKVTLYADKRGERNLVNVPGGDEPVEIRSVTS